MAARRISASAVNWTAFAERVPPTHRNNFLAFKTKSDNYLRRVLANPAEPPKIDWAFYKKSVPVAGLVDSFQKQYEALQIPYPTENVSAELDAQMSEAKKTIADFQQQSNQRIKKYEAEIARINALIPYEEMTMEDYYDAHPDLAWDRENPTFWPHDSKEVVDDSILKPSEDH